MLHDVRFALRTVARSPRFSALAVLTIAVGIGSNTALFSLLDAVVLRALPYRDADRLVEIWGRDEKRGGMRVPEPFLNALRGRARTLAAITVHGPVGGVLRTREGLVDLRGERVSANFVEVMGVPPLAGRGFRKEEERPGGPAVLLISHPFWQRHLGGDPEAVGRTVYLDQVAYTVIGIMPREFRTGFGRNAEVEFWTTHTSDAVLALERQAGYELVARLSPGASLEQAQREVAAIGASIEWKGWGKDGRRLEMLPKKTEILGDSAQPLKLLLAAVAVVLAIACANLAQLLLARGDRRVKEFATRKAMGAPTWQLFRLALLESLLLSAGGGLLGIAIAYRLLPILLSLAPADLPRITDAVIDGRVLAVAVALTTLTGIAFGTAPAVRLSRLPVAELIGRSGGRFTPGGVRFRSLLVLAQVAASVALFVLAGLLGRTFLKLLPSRPGFQAESRTVFPLFLPPKTYARPSDRARLMSRMTQRVETIPGVAAVALGSNIPYSGDSLAIPVRRVEEAAEREDIGLVRADRRGVSANYFHFFEMPLVRGRVFTAADGPDSDRVAIVNRRLARALGPAGEVLGRQVLVGRSAVRIVGVVADARSTADSAEPLYEIYTPYSQSGEMIVYLMVHSRFESAALTAAVRKEIRAAAPDLPLRAAEIAVPMEELVRRAMAAPRFGAMLSSAFSMTAWVLSAMGVFGLVAFLVSRRRREFGIRAALGATPLDLTVFAVRPAVVWTTAGVAVGLAVAAYATRFVESQLYATEPHDVGTFGGAAALMLATAGLAAYLPARAAGDTDPGAALRAE